MSFRPTIATYIEGKIGDIGYYRNWDDIECLLFEAVAIAVTFSDCRTLEEFRERKFHKQKIHYIINPERWENTQENLKKLEDCSEFPIVVDLSSSCIYVGCSGLTEEMRRTLPDAREMYDDGEIDDHTDFYDMLSRCRIVIDDSNREAIRHMFLTAPELRGHLSEETCGDLLRLSGPLSTEGEKRT